MPVNVSFFIYFAVPGALQRGMGKYVQKEIVQVVSAVVITVVAHTWFTGEKKKTKALGNRKRIVHRF